ncbi:MAG: CsgG/HfaB family protein [bacterium]
MKMIPVLSAFCALLLCGCAGGGTSVIKKDYDWSRIKRIGVLRFDSRFNNPKGVEDMFAKNLLKRGFSVIERSRLEQIIAEQKLGTQGLLSTESVKDLGKILGVDALMMGQVVSFIPESKDVAYVQTRIREEEPVFDKVTEKRTDGALVETLRQVGTKVSFSDSASPHVYTIYAEASLVAKLVDAETGEILWVGSYTNEGVNSLVALEGACDYLVSKFASDLPRPVKNQGASRKNSPATARYARGSGMPSGK